MRFLLFAIILIGFSQSAYADSEEIVIGDEVFHWKPTATLPEKRVPAANPMKEACRKRLQQMERVMQMKAPKNGNLSDPSVVDYYNQYQLEASICAGYK
jgi:hypothetical protein